MAKPRGKTPPDPDFAIDPLPVPPPRQDPARDLAPTPLARPSAARDTPRRPAPIVPRGSMSGRALVVTIAIMTFLAALTAGAVTLVAESASAWQSDIAREVTIQVRPVAGRDHEAEVTRAAALARAMPGIAEVRAYSVSEAARLLEPWLGGSTDLAVLPLPRPIIVRLAADGQADLAALATALARDIPGATLDDHRAWSDRLGAMATSFVLAGLVVLALVLVATGLTIVFATRGALATNRPVVEVLHFVGAEDRQIAREFEHHVLRLAAGGAAIGAVAAMAVFALGGLVAAGLRATPTGEQFDLLFGTFVLGPAGYAAVAAVALLVVGLTVATARRTVHNTLRSVDKPG